MGLRLYLDDCANDHLLRRLLEAPPHSHDVQSPQDAGLAGEDDDVHLAHARSANRIVLTKDPRDFAALHRADPNHPGIFVVYQDNRPGDMTPAEIVGAIANLVAAYEQAGLSLAGQVHPLNDWRY